MKFKHLVVSALISSFVSSNIMHATLEGRNADSSDINYLNDSIKSLAYDLTIDQVRNYCNGSLACYISNLSSLKKLTDFPNLLNYYKKALDNRKGIDCKSVSVYLGSKLQEKKIQYGFLYIYKFKPLKSHHMLLIYPFQDENENVSYRICDGNQALSIALLERFNKSQVDKQLKPVAQNLGLNEPKSWKDIISIPFSSFLKKLDSIQNYVLSESIQNSNPVPLMNWLDMAAKYNDKRLNYVSLINKIVKTKSCKKFKSLSENEWIFEDASEKTNDNTIPKDDYISNREI